MFIGILPGSKHDINFLKDLLNNNTMLEYLRNSVITGDKAFNSKELVEQFKNLDISLEPIKKGKVHHKQKERQSFLKRIRKRIETTFSKLYWMGIENIRAVSLDGFLAKLSFFVLGQVYHDN